jgi:anti-sigma regulatory factor (Ser/Thr protein kinase)
MTDEGPSMAAFGGRLRMRDDIQHKAETIALTVPSHPKYLYVIRSMLYPIVVEAGFSKKESRTIVLAVDEACSNIIKYAYEGDHSKLIVLTIVVEKTKLVIELKDSGKKPDVSRIIPRKLDDIRPGGLGTHFMAAVFDSVEYDTSSDAGTTLTLEKCIRDVRGRA